MAITVSLYRDLQQSRARCILVVWCYACQNITPAVSRDPLKKKRKKGAAWLRCSVTMTTTSISTTRLDLERLFVLLSRTALAFSELHSSSLKEGGRESRAEPNDSLWSAQSKIRATSADKVRVHFSGRLTMGPVGAC